MADVKPFQALRPANEFVRQIAALPYDVYNREEACRIVEKNSLSFLRIDRAETNFTSDVSTYDACVYQKAANLLQQMTDDGYFIKEQTSCYYLYRLTMNGRSQTGIVACASIDDYENGIIMKHENTRSEKEIDRIRHIDACNAQTGPIFLAYRQNAALSGIVAKIKQNPPLYDFVSEDDIGHTVWKIEDPETIAEITGHFSNIQKIYIADGHHRCASAVKVGRDRHKDEIRQESDYFLSVLFLEDELKILPYNRVIKDLNGLSKEGVLEKLQEKFTVHMGNSPVAPDSRGIYGMYLQDTWYRLCLKEEYRPADTVDGLDVSILQKYVFDAIFGIKDPKTDNRIDFVGGIRGLRELENRVKKDCAAAFSLYPTSIRELFDVADEGRLMPPKSTWFEPKLRSGLFIHTI